jgi:hypothetical protein
VIVVALSRSGSLKMNVSPKNEQYQDGVSDRLQKMEMVIHEIDSQLQHVQAMVIVAKNSSTENNQPQDKKNPMRDDVWACQNCGARLGIYNNERDELRVRYKDFVAYVTPGVGGKTMVPCRRCGEQNTLKDER